MKDSLKMKLKRMSILLQQAINFFIYLLWINSLGGDWISNLLTPLLNSDLKLSRFLNFSSGFGRPMSKFAVVRYAHIHKAYNFISPTLFNYSQ